MNRKEAKKKFKEAHQINYLLPSTGTYDGKVQGRFSGLIYLIWRGKQVGPLGRVHNRIFGRLIIPGDLHIDRYSTVIRYTTFMADELRYAGENEFICTFELCGFTICYFTLTKKK